MTGIYRNPNSIYIPMISTEFLNSEFDSTYPHKLNGIINQNEFQESINKINHEYSSFKIYVKIWWILFSLFIGIGIICFIISGITTIISLQFLSKIFFYIASVLVSGSPLFYVIGYCIISSQRTIRIRQVILKESIKYSSRSPKSCNWRFDISKTLDEKYKHYSNQRLDYYLIIDISRTISSENNNSIHCSNNITQKSTMFSDRSDNSPSLLCSEQSEGFCLHCGVERQEFIEKLCSLCAHSFNKY